MLPLAFAPGEDGEEIRREHPTLAIARLEAAGDRPAGVLYDAVVDPAFADALLDAIGGRRRFRAGRGEITGVADAGCSASCAAAEAHLAAHRPAPSRATARSCSATG